MNQPMIRWAGGYGMHGEKKNVYKVMIGSHERRRTLERLRCRWAYHIKMYLFREICGSHNSVAKGRIFWDVGLLRLVNTNISEECNTAIFRVRWSKASGCARKCGYTI